VGGIKEKVLAAKRAGIRTILLPFLNKKDLKEISARHREGIEFKFASKVEEIFAAALLAKPRR
jgi:ATP-dependent Lon protease